MKNSKDSENGKAMVHGHGAGQLSREDIEQRAGEIAIIKGRSEDDISADDRDEADAELSGEDIPSTTVEDSETRGSLSRDPSEPPAFYDRGLPTLEAPDEKKELERMVLDGVEEAQHEQMLEARRRRDL